MRFTTIHAIHGHKEELSLARSPYRQSSSFTTRKSKAILVKKDVYFLLIHWSCLYDVSLFLFSIFHSQLGFWSYVLTGYSLVMLDSGFNRYAIWRFSLSRGTLCGYLDICTRFVTNCCWYINHTSICILCIRVCFFANLTVYNNIILLFHFFVGEGVVLVKGWDCWWLYCHIICMGSQWPVDQMASKWLPKWPQCARFGIEAASKKGPLRFLCCRFVKSLSARNNWFALIHVNCMLIDYLTFWRW